MNHDTFSRNTRSQLKQVFDALRELMTPPDPSAQAAYRVRYAKGQGKDKLRALAGVQIEDLTPKILPTKALNQAVKRNAERFPVDFMFQLSAAEKTEVVTSCDHLQKLKFSKSLPYAFTEHGAIQAANVLASPRAVEMGIYVVRAFVRLKQASVLHADLAKRLAELEDKTEGIAMAHDTFSRNTRNQLKQVFDALRELMTPPDPPKRPIGFINPEDKGKKTSAKNKG